MLIINSILLVSSNRSFYLHIVTLIHPCNSSLTNSRLTFSPSSFPAPLPNREHGYRTLSRGCGRTSRSKWPGPTKELDAQHIGLVGQLHRLLRLQHLLGLRSRPHCHALWPPLLLVMHLQVDKSQEFWSPAVSCLQGRPLAGHHCPALW